MTQRLALTLAGAVTAFVLVLLGAIAATLIQGASASPLDQAARASAAPAAPPAPSAADQPSQGSGEAAGYAVTPDAASAVALGVAPGAALARPPELVNFQGAAAYELTLDRGLVYVAADSGQVLYSDVASPKVEKGKRDDKQDYRRDSKHDDKREHGGDREDDDD